MKKLKKNYERKSNSILAMAVCWCPCQGATCLCSDTFTENTNVYQKLVDSTDELTKVTNYI